MRVFRTLVVLVAIATLSLPGIASAMNKGELIDAIAKDAKLTKVDAGNALNAFAKEIGKILGQGYRVHLIDFGSFSLSKRAVRTDGCANEVEVEFIAGSEFNHGENPLAEEETGGGENSFYVEFSSLSDNGITSVSGWTEGAFRAGDEIIVLDVWEGVIQTDIIARGEVVGVMLLSVDGTEVILDAGEGDEVSGLLLRGIEKSDIRRGMVIAKPGSIYGAGDCPEEDAIVRDEELLALMVKEAQLKKEETLLAYNAMLNIIIEVVNTGEAVDLEDFGVFYEAYEIEALAHESVHVVQQRKGRNPQTGKEIKIVARGLTDTDMKRFEKMVENTVRTEGNPQTGNEMKIAAKKVAKFKAGKALADTVK